MDLRPGERRYVSLSYTGRAIAAQTGGAFDPAIGRLVSRSTTSPTIVPVSCATATAHQRMRATSERTNVRGIIRLWRATKGDYVDCLS